MINSSLQWKKEHYDTANICNVLAEAFARDYMSIAKVDLSTGDAVVIKSDIDSELEGKMLPWEDLIQSYAEHRACPQDRNKVLSITKDYLSEFLKGGKHDLSVEVRRVSENYRYIWVEINMSVISAQDKTVLITTRDINETRMLERIVDLFVYRDMDYFILLDAKMDTFTMFSGRKDGMPLPPSIGSYTEEVLTYNKSYVAPEEVERINANMMIPHILLMLERNERYCFTCMGFTEKGKLRQIRVQFQYYDKSEGLILLTRTDITQIYREEQIKSERLSAALRDAQLDALTQIYNQKAMSDLVTESLENLYRKRAALLFIDVDNFKMINDTLGHQKGDELLRYLASFIHDIAGRTGIAGRIGGDEFLVFLSTAVSAKEIEQCAVKICQIFDSIPDEEISALPISCSVGISIYPKDGTDYKTLLHKADQALYTSKRYGKKMHYFYSQELDLNL